MFNPASYNTGQDKNDNVCTSPPVAQPKVLLSNRARKGSEKKMIMYFL